MLDEEPESTPEEIDARITATPETIAHYMTPDIKATMLRVSQEGPNVRWAVADRKWWYQTPEKGYPTPMNSETYDILVDNFRTLYTTLAYYSPDIFTEDFSRLGNTGTILSKANTVDITFWIDIDAQNPGGVHGESIHDPKVKTAVEKMAQFFIGKLRPYAPNSIYALYSGGGIYIIIHHGVFKAFFQDLPKRMNPIVAIDALRDAMNRTILEMSTEFYDIYPEYRDLVQADNLVGVKRIFKNIFSIHKTLPYAVIPLDINNIHIDFNEARYPLSPEVIERGKQWYTTYDEKCRFTTFLDALMDELIEENPMKYEGKNLGDGSGITMKSKLKLEEIDVPPCINNILNMVNMGAGATRALSFLAAFMGHFSTPGNEAFKIFQDAGRQWGTENATAHVFNSWFKKMNCPSCKTLNTDTGAYPNSNIARIKACTPDERCMYINKTNPIYYADDELRRLYIVQKMVKPIPKFTVKSSKGNPKA